MKYDFDLVCDRSGTDCVKWDVQAVFGRRDIIPMWVADMDFPVAVPIVEALKKRAEHRFFGYTRPGKSVFESVTERMQRKFNWKIEPEWVVFTPGVIPALNVAVRAFTHPGDEVILQSPVYHPFYPAVTSSGCQIAINQLKLINGRYEMDYEDLRQKFLPKQGLRPGPNRIKAVMLCNPHNPVGRVWNKDELTLLGEIAIRGESAVISDEIHCELLFKGYKHTPFASISTEFEQNCVVCMSPSKTFNLPGLSIASIIIPNKKLREAFIAAGTGILSHPTIFGQTALEAAYRFGDEWLEQVLYYLQRNLEYAIEYFEKRIPRIKVVKPEGTYLIWLDCRDLNMDAMALRTFMREKARVGMDDGFIFGPGGGGFERMNIGCPRAILREALERIEAAMNSLPA
ncbi:MAG: pyridoxal phosphate-dependent aminotransferase [Chloroflexi bacterium]|nr:pyridoxal phosphate-dependent aminotransferase [Chloroflexota bacterium]